MIINIKLICLLTNTYIKLKYYIHAIKIEYLYKHAS